jgi:hypothetical protein
MLTCFIPKTQTKSVRPPIIQSAIDLRVEEEEEEEEEGGEITNTQRQHELFYQTPRHVIQDNEIATWQTCWVNNLKGRHTARINVSR